MNKRAIFIIFLLIIFTLPLDGFCAWGQDTIPVPPYTKEERREKVNLGGTDFAETFYSSELSFEEIAGFYKENLAKSGWVDLGLDENVIKNVGEEMLETNVILAKGQERLTVQKMPDFTEGRAKTRFVVVKQKVPVENEEIVESQMQAAGIKDFKGIPAYPGNTRLLASTSTQASYETEDSVESVIEFYRQQMPGIGWQLDQEIPVTKQMYDPGQMGQNEQYKELLKNQTQEMKEGLEGSSMTSSHLRFIKGGKICTIGAAQTEFQGDKEKTTLIYINSSD